ncbi:uncharacterized protein LOC107177421 [Citrus sinensis]|uniref:uncharacterized protein LOC107177421 n=1 Tax=Citrus sinensis TaxID=2711 RepID=UPI0007637124|nr:uncharacterized protein LOC107177421 [Citrus sinensis]
MKKIIESSKNLGHGENPIFRGIFPPPFREARTTKKARFRDEENAGDNPTQVAYKENLVNVLQALEQGFVGGIEDWEFEEGDVIENNEGPMPSITFSARVHEKLSKPWKNSVVVKLLGRTIRYKTLCARLNVLWKTAMSFSVIDLENNYFLVHFCSAGDAVDALTKGPSLIMGQFLTVQPLMPSFDFTNTVFDQVMIWPNCSKYLLGQAVSISFELDGKAQKVEYEGLPVIYFKCGRYGHNSNNCKKAGTSTTSGNVGQPQHVMQCNEALAQQEVGHNDDNIVEPFRRWMIATRRCRKSNSGKENINDSNRNCKHAGAGTSRFQILAQVTDECENPVHAAFTDISSTSRQPLLTISNPTFTSNEDITTKDFGTMQVTYQGYGCKISEYETNCLSESNLKSLPVECS